MKRARTRLLLWSGAALLVACNASAPPPPPLAPAAPVPPEVPASDVVIDHGALIYEWHARLPTGAFSGLRAWSDGAVEVGGTGPSGLRWATLRQLSAVERAAFDALSKGPAIAALPPVIQDPTAPIDARVRWTVVGAAGPREILVEGAARTRIPALEELDRVLLGANGPTQRRSYVVATTTDGGRTMGLACDALSQDAFRGIAMLIQDIPTPGSVLPGSPVALRVETVAGMQSAVLQVHDDGALVRLDADGVASVGMLDPTRLSSVRRTLDRLPWDKADTLCTN